ncbi:ComF family protein [Pseudooceanicola sp. 216_PA32_1]|uniref:ComF family protein n=1 Tax=Pseudooceanicola pacificus TaxID=2676438 RepID=A0A844WAY2_9RHOB|nr:ComF family protein [Pseudooceanicola pacificus]MWB76972.1 ComF family protein [Pseudooceanicola pacificus]
MNIQTALHLVYPPRCLTCGDEVQSDFGLCGPCWRDTPFATGLVCDLCGLPLPGGAPGEVAHCDECLRYARPWRQGRAAMVYDGTARRMVLGLKHGDRQDIATPAAHWMRLALADVNTRDMLVSPVPLHRWRLLKRRYNQSALIGRALSDMLELEFIPDLLVRTRRTAMLDGKGVAQRFAALDRAIAVPIRRRESVEGRHVLLVDDVMTSGATLTAASIACLEAGAADVSVVTLARAVKGA